MDIKFSNSCVLCKLNISCAICQPTLRKNVIKEWKFFNRHEVFQPLLTNETMEAGSHKRRKKHKK